MKYGRIITERKIHDGRVSETLDHCIETSRDSKTLAEIVEMFKDFIEYTRLQKTRSLSFEIEFNEDGSLKQIKKQHTTKVLES